MKRSRNSPPDLVGALADGGADHGVGPRVARRGLHFVERGLEDPVERPAPAGMGRRHDARRAVAEQDRLAIGGEDRDGEPGRGGDDGIGRHGSVSGPDSVTARAVCAWCTVTSRSAGTSSARATRSRLVETMAD
jgi:hypothetical protein